MKNIYFEKFDIPVESFVGELFNKFHTLYYTYSSDTKINMYHINDRIRFEVYKKLSPEVEKQLEDLYKNLEYHKEFIKITEKEITELESKIKKSDEK